MALMSLIGGNSGGGGGNLRFWLVGGHGTRSFVQGRHFLIVATADHLLRNPRDCCECR